MLLVSTAVSIIVIAVVFTLHRRRQPSHPYPPGPKGKLLVGNIADLPKEYPWLTFSKLGKEYGPITYLNMMGQSVIVINDHKTAIDLLEKRGSIYSDRYYSVMAMELAGFDIVPILQNYTSRLRFQRKIMHGALGQGVAQRDVWPLQEKETRIYLNCLLDQPDAFLEDLLHCEGGILLKLTYGAVTDAGLDFAKMSLDIVKAFTAATSGHLVDVFPFLKYLPDWMPGAEFKRQAAQWKEITVRNMNAPFEMVKRMKAAGEAPPSYCTRLLEENEENGGGYEIESSILETAGLMYSAGTETTTGVIQVFFLAMLLYPEAQQQAQEEIDKVIGNDRLPSLRDRGSLPYVEAVFLECLRWYPVSPIAIPHRLRQDDVYNGYFIPSGTVVYPNTWEISRDEKQYPCPDQFDPLRWMSKTHKPLDPRTFAFGYGRRICPGMHIAQASVWIAIASVLSTFNVKKRKNSAGEDIVPPLEFESGVVCRPMPFVCDLKPRSEKAVSLIRESGADI